MTTSEMAKALGQKGGQARAARLSAADRKHIAALGGQARKASLAALRRIDQNFTFLAAVDDLHPPTVVRRVTKFAGPLPGIRATEA